jgi:hypothetical protein
VSDNPAGRKYLHVENAPFVLPPEAFVKLWNWFSECLSVYRKESVPDITDEGDFSLLKTSSKSSICRVFCGEASFS